MGRSTPIRRSTSLPAWRSGPRACCWAEAAISSSFPRPINTSTRNAAQFTSRRPLINFTGGPAHALAWSGSDLGASYQGYVNNFAIGTLELSAGNTLTLEPWAGPSMSAAVCCWTEGRRMRRSLPRTSPGRSRIRVALIRPTSITIRLNRPTPIWAILHTRPGKCRRAGTCAGAVAAWRDDSGGAGFGAQKTPCVIFIFDVPSDGGQSQAQLGGRGSRRAEACGCGTRGWAGVPHRRVAGTGIVN